MLKRGSGYAPPTEVYVEPLEEFRRLLERLARHLNWSGVQVDAVVDRRDGVRSLWAGWRAQTGGTEGTTGRRHSGWSFVLRDPGLYMALGILALWERVVRH